MPLDERVRHELTAEVPGLDEEWAIGAIVGPSGSGKTTLARAAFGDELWKPRTWPRDQALIDCFGDLPVKKLTLVLASVGLGSPPTWLKPYCVLSTGERFRADLARAVVQESGGRGQESGKASPVVVYDEFTSSLDRTVAKTTSAALARLLRGESVGRRSATLSPTGMVGTAHPTNRWPRFVAVTCHDDILPWLSPDWILRLGGTGLAPRLIWQRPTQPSLSLIIDRVPQAMWAVFAPHHYLAGRLAASATCYAAFLVQRPRSKVQSHNASTLDRPASRVPRLGTLDPAQPIAFCAVAAALGWKKTKRIQRLVVLPEFQGLGVGGKLLNAVAGEEAKKGNRVTITASHPAVLAHCSNSQRWRLIGVKKNGSTRQRFEGREVGSSVGRAVVSFEFLAGES